MVLLRWTGAQFKTMIASTVSSRTHQHPVLNLGGIMEELCNAAADTIHHFTNQYIKKFGFEKARNRKVEDRTVKMLNRLVHASYVEEKTYEGILKAVKNLSYVFLDIELDAGANYLEMTKWRKSLEEINSIMHIGRTYPDNAIIRLKHLEQNPVKKDRIIKPE